MVHRIDRFIAAKVQSRDTGRQIHNRPDFTRELATAKTTTSSLNDRASRPTSRTNAVPSQAQQPVIATAAGNPFSGSSATITTEVSKNRQPQFVAPEIAPPPALSNRPQSISNVTTVDAVIYNSARSVQLTNAQYNEQAYESYNKAVREWQDNNGRRWIGNVFAQTVEPPPVPKYLPTDYNEIYADIAANYQTGKPYEDPYVTRPYYMGGSVFFEAKNS